MKKILSFDRLPTDVEQLIAASDLSTPFETAALTVLALHHYTTDSDMAVRMLNYLKGPEQLGAYDLQFLRDRFRSCPFVMRSYFLSSSPENNYEVASPYQIEVSENPYSYQQEGYAKLFLRSTGADSPRPIVLRRKGDRWFLWEQLLLAGIREPKSQDPWA